MRNRLASIPWFAIALCVAAAYALFARLLSPAVLTFYEDDAFYYFQIARNIVSFHLSSFDGIHLTNGYHPLWMVTVAIVTLISSGKAFFVLLQCIAFASFVATLFLARSTFRHFATNSVLAEIAAGVVALESLLLLRCGMEVTLTIPLVLLLCWFRLRPQFRWTPTTAARYGLLCAVIVLSRLDTALLIFVLFVLELVFEHPASPRQWTLRAYAALFCGLPLSLYVLSNHHWFHVWMPISGEAKQLRLHHTFNLTSIAASLGPVYLPYRVLIVYPTALLLLFCLTAFFKPANLRGHRNILIVSLSLIALPFLQALAFWTTSDWPIWPWYIYSIPLAMTGGLLILFTRYSEANPRKDALLLIQAGVLTLAFLYAATCTPGQQRSRWYAFGIDMQTFAQTHPGIYAMGDCAGTTGYLIHQPLIQLEGLVMDAPFLEDIREQRNLNGVLQSYDVRYYVTADVDLVDGCYHTTEPGQAGPDSPHMSGSFCTPPIATYPHQPTGATLYVFDLKPDAASPR